MAEAKAGANGDDLVGKNVMEPLKTDDLEISPAVCKADGDKNDEEECEEEEKPEVDGVVEPGQMESQDVD